MHIRPATRADFDTILALNEASVSVLAPMDLARLEALDAKIDRLIERTTR